MAAKVRALREPAGAQAVTAQTAVDDFLSSPRCANANTRRAYAGVLDRLLAELDPSGGAEGRLLGDVDGDELAPSSRNCGAAPARRPGTATGPPSWPG